MKADRKRGWEGNCRVNPGNWTKSDQDRRREFSADYMLKGQNSSLRITSVSDNNSKKFSTTPIITGNYYSSFTRAQGTEHPDGLFLTATSENYATNW